MLLSTDFLLRPPAAGPAVERARIAGSRAPHSPAESVLHFKEIQDSREIVTLSCKKTRERGEPGREEEGIEIEQQLCHLRKIPTLQFLDSKTKNQPNELTIKTNILFPETCFKT